ncbi:hypothetical protein IU438_18090 [Nocardia cyriacigeorgica]|uniref:hypothetical protein n=1 Tax=Nocardia cyriacigeorgica TaxID=135487 RepID=UPI0018961231|nr:hypothetical protein [Nocardia cyriacigeorgica]MBF6397702.1 hypothetical protein [Nocardia cyriacigeorgica]MBF6402640.1 hypothetical protein [Nocardia cyriacigeorgica]
MIYLVDDVLGACVVDYVFDTDDGPIGRSCSLLDGRPGWPRGAHGVTVDATQIEQIARKLELLAEWCPEPVKLAEAVQRAAQEVQRLHRWAV